MAIFFDVEKKWYYIDTLWHPGKIPISDFRDPPPERAKNADRFFSPKNACPLPPRRAIDKRTFFSEFFFPIFSQKKFVTLAGVFFLEKKIPIFRKFGPGRKKFFGKLHPLTSQIFSAKNFFANFANFFLRNLHIFFSWRLGKKIWVQKSR